MNLNPLNLKNMMSGVGLGENSRATKGEKLIILIKIDEGHLGIAQHWELMGFLLHTQVPFCKGCFSFGVILDELDGNLILTHCSSLLVILGINKIIPTR